MIIFRRKKSANCYEIAGEGERVEREHTGQEVGRGVERIQN
jgi:hypothetical protein